MRMKIQVQKRLYTTLVSAGTHIIHDAEHVCLTAQVANVLGDTLAQSHATVHRAGHHYDVTARAMSDEIFTSTVFCKVRLYVCGKHLLQMTATLSMVLNT